MQSYKVGGADAGSSDAGGAEATAAEGGSWAADDAVALLAAAANDEVD